jgi:hypothetical protein
MTRRSRACFIRYQMQGMLEIAGTPCPSLGTYCRTTPGCAFVQHAAVVPHCSAIPCSQQAAQHGSPSIACYCGIWRQSSLAASAALQHHTPAQPCSVQHPHHGIYSAVVTYTSTTSAAYSPTLGIFLPLAIHIWGCTAWCFCRGSLQWEPWGCQWYLLSCKRTGMT